MRQLQKELVFQQGLPLVLTNTMEGWDRELFSWSWLRNNSGKTELVNSPRNVDTLQDETGWRLEDYLDYLEKPKPGQKASRLYGKDILAPTTWRTELAKHLPPCLHYRGQFDLVRHLPAHAQPLSMMIYIGAEATRTPGHIDIVGSLGHNLMVHSDPDATAYWFMLATGDKDKARAYWESMGAYVDHDNYWMDLEAPFPVYVVKQQVGDLVLVPPETVHQVMNASGRSTKIAWNTVHAQTLKNCYEILPLYRDFAKYEVYRVRSLAYYGLEALLRDIRPLLTYQAGTASEERVADELTPLLAIFSQVLDSEWIESPVPIEAHIPEDEQPHMRLCNICNADIFNRWFHCTSCSEKEEQEFDICLECAADGQTCPHPSSLKLWQHLSMGTLLRLLSAAKDLALARAVLPALPPRQSLLSAATLAWRKLGGTDPGLATCHQCKMGRPGAEVATCALSTDCTAAYCRTCLWNGYGLRLTDCQRDKFWTCPQCLGSCHCPPCLRRNNVDPQFVAMTFPERRKVGAPLVYADYAASRKGRQTQHGYLFLPASLGSNAEFCDRCEGTGPLLPCEACPRAFHLGCLSSPTPGPFRCDQCLLLPGTLVWAKSPSFPWWPAQISSLDKVEPLSFRKECKANESPSTLIVKFFGSGIFAQIPRQFIRHFDPSLPVSNLIAQAESGQAEFLAALQQALKRQKENARAPPSPRDSNPKRQKVAS